MFNVDDYTAQLSRSVIAASGSVETVTEMLNSTKRDLFGCVCHAIVGRLLADDAASHKSAGVWLSEAAPNASTKNTVNAYRSAIKWRVDDATLAAMRSAMGPISALTVDEFLAYSAKAATDLGDVLKDYKAEKSAPKVEAAKPAPLPELEAAPAPVLDDVELALTQALAAIAILQALGATDALVQVSLALEADAVAAPAPVAAVA